MICDSNIHSYQGAKSVVTCGENWNETKTHVDSIIAKGALRAQLRSFIG